MFGRHRAATGWNDLFGQRFKARVTVKLVQQRIDPNRTDVVAVAILV
jgi:hypothetical protein